MIEKSIKLVNGVEIPVIGFGVFRAESGTVTEKAVLDALEAGYRHIDTAMIYKNEESVGNALKKSGICRKEIFVTTKLWNEDIRNGNVRDALEESLKKLQLDYVDLYLIHWPANGYEKAWPILEELYEEGKIKAIGVSNFHKHHFEEIAKISKIKPMINQIESNPNFNNQELIDYCLSEGVAVEVYSPLGGNATTIVDNEKLIEIGQKYGKSAAQVIIRWHLQKSVIVLPKSVTTSRIVSNIDVFDFELTTEEMQMIYDLNKNERVGADPDNFNF